MRHLPKIIFIVGAIALLGTFLSPIWRITLEAPQYPQGVTMYIWINKIGGSERGTLQNINILNHYVGMKMIEPESIPELKYFPKVIIGMAVLAPDGRMLRANPAFCRIAGRSTETLVQLDLGGVSDPLQAEVADRRDGRSHG